MNNQITIREIWQKSMDPYDFIERAKKNGYGVWTIKKTLQRMGMNIPKREIKNIVLEEQNVK